MGIMNLRAICPNRGGKIHTQPKGLGHLTWARSWFLVQTGTTCQHCGVALTGKVKANNQAELAPNQPTQTSAQPPDSIATTTRALLPSEIGRLAVCPECGWKVPARRTCSHCGASIR
jgi:hypothetical protein